MKTKRTTIVKKVCSRLSIAMFLVNLFAIVFLVIFIGSKLNQADELYFTEIVANISSTIDTTMNAYFHTAEVLAANKSIITLLEESNKSNPMEKNSNINNILDELSEVVASYNGSVINITILSVAEDSYIMSDGTVSTRTTVTDRSYYEAVTSKKTIITAPYEQSQNNTRVVSTSAPVFSTNGTVLGCVVVNIPTSFVSTLVSTIGTTGSSWVIDNSNEILAHPNSSYIGQDYSSAGVTGSEFLAELSNPTGTLIHYYVNGVDRAGFVGSVGDLGWRLIAGMNTSEYEEDTNSVAVMLVTILLISMVISLLVCGITVYVNLMPMKELNSAMLEMSKGNLAHLPEHEGNDEIGELCDNLRTTMSNLDIYIKEIQANLDAFGNGDFTRESTLTFLGDFLAIQTSTEHFKSLITSTLESLTSTVEQVSLGSDYVATGAQNLAEGSAKQTTSVSDLNKFISNITVQIKDNAKNVSEVNKAAQTISSELVQSNGQMDEMMLAMTDIQTKSEGITKIVKTIQDVAFQTNILALNAAVEAARAGNAGKGFAVVAEEVRNLSSRTSEAVKNTTLLIDESIQAVNKGNSIANATMDNLKFITEEISSFISTLEEIAVASEEQSEAIFKISEGVNEITDVMHSNSAVSEESAATSEELSSQAEVMKEAIGQFKLN